MVTLLVIRGKYLRLKRIHFQLPYDVMFLWQNNQLQKQPAVPLKRKRRYCRLKGRIVSSHRTAESSSDITSLFPHLDMEPLTSSERYGENSANNELRGETPRVPREELGADQQVGVEVTVTSSDPHHQSQDTSSSLTASPCLFILVQHSPPAPRTGKMRTERKKKEGKKRSAAENRGGNG
ncbi:Histone-lysine N-methyltransferase ASH1L [Liparis tanakae]|uniref:Histone-lysine N-methyltransferase ASH1L n=1 Tax=Liparis tanakae TaxID=230148 RepID=A0A4Z2I4R4_9TELE|nr:Histone-lysine N-methyltransferase ASH1L [Liparis tanakae]